MIPANEFWLNKMYYRKHGKGWTPTVIDEDIIGKVFSNSHEYALNDFEPITLIPAILDKCGFVKDGFGGYGKSINPFDKGHKLLYFAGDYLYLKQSDHDQPSIYDKDYDICCLWNKDLVKEFYLHQLQNLHFALTGEELPINL